MSSVRSRSRAIDGVGFQDLIQSLRETRNGHLNDRLVIGLDFGTTSVSLGKDSGKGHLVWNLMLMCL